MLLDLRGFLVPGLLDCRVEYLGLLDLCCLENPGLLVLLGVVLLDRIDLWLGATVPTATFNLEVTLPAAYFSIWSLQASLRAEIIVSIF